MPSAAATAPRPSVARRAVLLGLLTAVVYLLVAGGLRFSFSQSAFPHHLLTADAMLHGRLDLRPEVLESHARHADRLAHDAADFAQRVRGETWPPEVVQAYVRSESLQTLDLAEVNGRFYTYWGPLTSVLAIPWVAAFGPGASDRLLNALFGAANVGLAYWMFRRVDRCGLRRLSEPCCVALTLLLAFGTVHFYLSAGGRVWFAVQVCTLTALLLSIIAIASMRLSGWACALAGMMFGAAFLGRSVVVLLALFYPVMIWVRSRDGGRQVFRLFAVRVLAFAVPVAVAGAVQLAYNHARFGDWRETGQGITVHTRGDPRFRSDYDQYGSFHPAYLATNLKYYAWNVAFPVMDGVRTFDPQGNSMFFITPPLLYVFAAGRRRDGFTLALLAGAVPMVAALLVFRATGYYQFGNRYLLDAMPLLLLLVATGMDGRLSRFRGSLIIAAVAVNVFGTIRFYPELVGIRLYMLSTAWFVVAGHAAMVAWWLIRRRNPSWGEVELSTDG